MPLPLASLRAKLPFSSKKESREEHTFSISTELIGRAKAILPTVYVCNAKCTNDPHVRISFQGEIEQLTVTSSSSDGGEPSSSASQHCSPEVATVTHHHQETVLGDEEEDEDEGDFDIMEEKEAEANAGMVA